MHLMHAQPIPCLNFLFNYCSSFSWLYCTFVPIFGLLVSRQDLGLKGFMIGKTLRWVGLVLRWLNFVLSILTKLVSFSNGSTIHGYKHHSLVSGTISRWIRSYCFQRWTHSLKLVVACLDHFLGLNSHYKKPAFLVLFPKNISCFLRHHCIG